MLSSFNCKPSATSVATTKDAEARVTAASAAARAGARWAERTALLERLAAEARDPRAALCVMLRVWRKEITLVRIQLRVVKLSRRRRGRALSAGAGAASAARTRARQAEVPTAERAAVARADCCASARGGSGGGAGGGGPQLQLAIAALLTRAAAGFTPSSKDELSTAVNAWVTNLTTANATYGHISGWDTSLITDMSYLFCCDNWCVGQGMLHTEGKRTFNDDISSWNTGTTQAPKRQNYD